MQRKNLSPQKINFSNKKSFAFACCTDLEHWNKQISTENFFSPKEKNYTYPKKNNIFLNEKILWLSSPKQTHRPPKEKNYFFRLIERINFLPAENFLILSRKNHPINTGFSFSFFRN